MLQVTSRSKISIPVSAKPANRTKPTEPNSGRVYGCSTKSSSILMSPEARAYADKIRRMNEAAYRSWSQKERTEHETDWSNPEEVLKERFGPLCNPVYDGPATDMSGQLTGEQSWMVTINQTRHVYVSVGWSNGTVIITEQQD